MISISAICVPACHCTGGCALTIPPPHTLPSYPRTQTSPASSFQGHDHWGGTSTPQSWARGGDTYDWRAAAPTLFVFLPCSMGITGGYALTILPPHTLPSYPWTQTSPASSFQGHDHWGGTSTPQSWARGGDTYDWRAAAPTLFVFLPCSMLRRDLTPASHTSLPPPPHQHPCTT